MSSSLDEAVYYRLAIDRENVANCLVMIQPSLTQYDMENDYPSAALCDISSLKNDLIILMDCYFYIVTWYGTTIDSWMQQGYQDLPEYEHFKAILEMPAEDTKVSNQFLIHNQNRLTFEAPYSRQNHSSEDHHFYPRRWKRKTSQV